MTVLSAAAWVVLASIVVAGVLFVGHWLLKRGVTRHEFWVAVVALVGIGALVFAHILGVRLDGAVRLSVTADSWLPILAPLAIAAISLALLRGKA